MLCVKCWLIEGMQGLNALVHAFIDFTRKETATDRQKADRNKESNNKLHVPYGCITQCSFEKIKITKK